LDLGRPALLPLLPKVNFLASSRGSAKSSPRVPGALRSAKSRPVSGHCCGGLSPAPGVGAMDATALERDAVQFARLAVQRDHEGRYSEAVFYYKVGVGRIAGVGSGGGLRPRGRGPGAEGPLPPRPLALLFPRPSRLQPPWDLRVGPTASLRAAVLAGKYPPSSRLMAAVVRDGDLVAGSCCPLALICGQGRWSLIRTKCMLNEENKK
jgi:hypothetical protein